MSICLKKLISCDQATLQSKAAGRHSVQNENLTPLSKYWRAST